MKVALRIVAVVFVAVAALLVYAVINALGSSGGAKPAVAVGYVVGAAVLVFAAAKLWVAGAKRGRLNSEAASPSV